MTEDDEESDTLLLKQGTDWKRIETTAAHRF